MATEDLSDWRLVSALTVYEIALLAKGYNPADHLDHTQWPPEINRETCGLVRGLQDAMKERQLRLDVHRSSLPRLHEDNADWTDIKLSVSSVREWLTAHNFGSEFFEPTPGFVEGDVSNTQNPHFAFKLAAAVRAWEYVSAHPETRLNKRPKTAIKNWLEDNAEELGLLKRDGELNRSAIEEIATVANWDQSGGAPATNDVTT